MDAKNIQQQMQTKTQTTDIHTQMPSKQKHNLPAQCLGTHELQRGGVWPGGDDLHPAASGRGADDGVQILVPQLSEG